MPKKKDPPLSDAEQRKRFEALARETGSDAPVERLKRVIKSVARSAVSPERKPPRNKK